MSQENVELAARWYEVAASKAELLAGIPRTMGLCQPEVEWRGPEDATTDRDRNGRRRTLEERRASIDDYRCVADGIGDCGGDEVLVVGGEGASGAMSGAEVRAIVYELLTIRSGLIVRVCEFYDESNALEAAGLQE